jgi:hypothetical protein
MENKLLAPIVIIGVFFGIIGGLMAFVNSYEGYSHFPMIGKKRRLVMSLEMGAAALGFGIVSSLTVFLLIRHVAG